MYYEVKSKINSTLVQLTANFFNETKRIATKFEGLEKKEKNNSNSLSKLYWCTGSILYGGRIESDSDTIEIILVGSLPYRIMDSSHKTNTLV